MCVPNGTYFQVYALAGFERIVHHCCSYYCAVFAHADSKKITITK